MSQRQFITERRRPLLLSPTFSLRSILTSRSLDNVQRVAGIDMQQETMAQNTEGQFADGFGESATLYGAPLQWNYIKPARMATISIKELDASPPSPATHERPRIASRFSGESYNPAANAPQFRRHAQRLQLAAEPPPRTSSLGYSDDLILADQFPRPPMGHSISSPSTVPLPRLRHGYHVPLRNSYYSSQAPTPVASLLGS